MELISKAVGWENKETLLDEYYPSGRSCKGGNAYPLLMLLKCMVIQNWFHMPRDPELEKKAMIRYPLRSS
jgi:hypothetical protein